MRVLLQYINKSFIAGGRCPDKHDREIGVTQLEGDLRTTKA